jgi:hypothetical protein
LPDLLGYEECGFLIKEERNNRFADAFGIDSRIYNSGEVFLALSPNLTGSELAGRHQTVDLTFFGEVRNSYSMDCWHNCEIFNVENPRGSMRFFEGMDN